MIELVDVSFSYDKNSYLEDISVSFEKEDITTIIGPNGCGKSTLLKLSSRILAPKNGKVLLYGQDISEMKRKAFAREVSVLMQNNLSPPMTVENAVLSGRYPYQAFGQLLSKEDKAIAEEAMKVTCCDSFRGKEMNRLSGGERQRVFLAMVLAQDTDIIFLDEPTTYLDINVCYDIMELIARLNREFGKTIILVLHDLNLALNYSHKMILMEKGKIISRDTPQNMAIGGSIGKVFGVSIKQVSNEGRSFFYYNKIT
ncbi:ABC transporter ATP-binding protein [Sinanaerobacter chloroacetimidivorans]|jgi:iron complex transport system ATP-binding protein|uniref:ABC transporter ATP-binding protein n=1 Tax=Sinanaerobacter chloroacetimidivorans TaxID=2818044 RepID=A0A8J7W1P2_9FIRM|nr:ABC transporter ATP-binding protein [Sinanaerobacter chloroacetimidivorans]MBR0597275.1 ABC transporter ATP-binding protein [Sinanaerobacter chloroacetimidivorans]